MNMSPVGTPTPAAPPTAIMAPKTPSTSPSSPTTHCQGPSSIPSALGAGGARHHQHLRLSSSSGRLSTLRPRRFLFVHQQRQPGQGILWGSARAWPPTSPSSRSFRPICLERWTQPDQQPPGSAHEAVWGIPRPALYLGPGGSNSRPRCCSLRSLRAQGEYVNIEFGAIGQAAIRPGGVPRLAFHQVSVPAPASSQRGGRRAQRTLNMDLGPGRRPPGRKRGGPAGRGGPAPLGWRVQAD